MEKKKYVTLDEFEDKYFGLRGTPEREEYEFTLSMEILARKSIKLEKKKIGLKRN